jgi:hypothetical protein
MKDIINYFKMYAWLGALFLSFVFIHAYNTKDWSITFLVVGIILIPLGLYGFWNFLMSNRIKRK